TMSEFDLSVAAGIQYLTADNTEFTRTPGRMLSITTNGETVQAVYLHASFPHTNRRKYISVRTVENKEIGIIEDLDAFPDETVRLLEEQMQIRYFAPVITKVRHIREEFGYAYWDTETTSGACRFTLRTGGNHIRLVTESQLLVTDV